MTSARDIGSGRSSVLRTALAALFFAAAVAVLGARAWTLVNVPGHAEADHWVLQDFRDAIYYPVVALLEGVNPYDAHLYAARYPVGQEFPLYSPLTLLLHLPFGALPYEWAEAAYFSLTIALTVVLAAVSLRLAGIAARADAVLALGALLLLSRPGQSNLLLGQSTLPWALAALAALRLSRTRPLWAAAAVALATFKPTAGLPLAVLLAARGDWRVALTGVAGGGALAALVAVGPVLYAGGVAPFVASLLADHRTFAGTALVQPLTSWLRVDAWALIARLVGGDLGAVAKLAVTLLVLGGTAPVLWRLARRRGAAVDHLGTALASLAILAAVYHQTYDLMLLAPTAVAVVLGRPPALWAAWPRLRWLLSALLLAMFANYAASNTVLAGLGLGGGWWLAVVSINGALLLAAWVTYGTLALQYGRAEARVPAARRRVWTRRRVGAVL